MINRKLLVLIISLLVVMGLVPVTFTNAHGKVADRSSVPMPTPVDKPPYSEYKGVVIGLTAEAARAKLGTPKDKSDEQDYYEFSDRESAQIYYDAAHMVKAITVTYSGKLDAVPTPLAVFGEAAEVKPDGGIFKLVRYPKAGFWISYNKTGGDDPLIMIAMQKM